MYSVPAITTSALPDALKDSAGYSAQLAVSGGSGTGTWAKAAGTLPTGLSLSSSGVISGTATVNGDYSFTVKYTDGTTAREVTRVLTIHVGNIAIRTAMLPDGDVGTAYSVQFDGNPKNLLPGGWSVANGSTLPAGLSFSGTGLLSGTPTVAGDYTFTIDYFVALKGTRSRTYTLHITP